MELSDIMNGDVGDPIKRKVRDPMKERKAENMEDTIVLPKPDQDSPDYDKGAIKIRIEPRLTRPNPADYFETDIDSLNAKLKDHNSPITVLREVGSGAMGLIYEVEYGGVRRAMKVLNPKVLRNHEWTGRYDLKEDAIKRFDMEASVAQRMCHSRDGKKGLDRIVKVYEQGNYDHVRHFIMDFVEGPSLYDFIKLNKGNLDTREYRHQAFKYSIQAIEGIEFLHDFGSIPHRDVKPANILIDSETDSVKLADFGLAKYVHSDKERTPALMGTLDYMSPDQARYGIRQIKTVPAKSDVFSLGAVLYEVFTGKKLRTRPDEEEEDQAILEAILSRDDLEDLSLVPEPIRPVIQWCLEDNPKKRPDATQLKYALIGAAFNMGITEEEVRGYSLNVPKDNVARVYNSSRNLFDFEKDFDRPYLEDCKKLIFTCLNEVDEDKDPRTSYRRELDNPNATYSDEERKTLVEKDRLERIGHKLAEIEAIRNE